MADRSIGLVVGLGNPGPEHEQDRHNVGYWFVDELARLHGGAFKSERKFHGDCCRINLDGHELWLLKPTTYMNRSGLSVNALAAYYKISPAEVLVVHDDLDLETGTVRIKFGGGHGGHNGLRNVIANIGRDFYRLRFGIGHPGNRNEVIDFVLTRPSRDEQEAMNGAVKDAANVMPLWLGHGDEKAMHQLHSRGVMPRKYRKDQPDSPED